MLGEGSGGGEEGKEKEGGGGSNDVVLCGAEAEYVRDKVIDEEQEESEVR